MEVLKIEWDTGYMVLNTKNFFPCTLQIARKIAPLINRCCTEEDRAALLAELHSMAEGYQRSIQENKDKLKEFCAEIDSMGKPDLKPMKRCEIEIWKNETLKKRAERAIKLIEEGERVE